MHRLRKQAFPLRCSLVTESSFFLERQSELEIREEIEKREEFQRERERELKEIEDFHDRRLIVP
jgi:hypothetical protein